VAKKSPVERSSQNLQDFCEWINKTPEQFKQDYINARKNGELDWDRETRNSILRFYYYIQEKGCEINIA